MNTRGLNPDPIDELPSDMLSALGNAQHVEGLRAANLERGWMNVRANKPTRSSHKKISFRYLGIAAAVIIAIVGIKYIPTQTPHTKTYSTAPGQRATITLADGSTATLAPATKLTANGRDINLVGQAIFTVNPNPNSPFTVHTGNTSTRVLGTTFSVRKYDDDINAEVVVAQGRVSMNGVVLSTGDIGTAAGSKINVTHDANISASLSWADGKLVFDEQTLREAIPELERWYGIQIAADASLLNKRIITTLNTETAAEAIRLISSALGARGEMKGNHATIYSQGK